MADRVSVTIRIGGTLERVLLEDLQTVIEREGAAIDWEGTEFSASDLPSEGPLALMANEVAWGRFDDIEEFCRCHGLAFTRWSGGCPGNFGPERVVFDGRSERSFPVTDDDEVVISHDEVRRLGTIAAINAHFAAAAVEPPPFIIVDAPIDSENLGGHDG